MKAGMRIRHTRTEPVAPVVGGMYWLSPYFGPIDLLLSDGDAPGHASGIPDEQESSPSPSETITAPRVLSAPPMETMAREEYVYQPRAYDSNCNGFTWYLEKAPRGMNVDRYSGKVVWTPPRSGYAEIALCARNLYGAVARQCWTLCIRKAVVVRRTIINRRFSEALKRKAARKDSPVRVCWRGKGICAGARNLPSTSPPGERRRADIPLRM